MIHKIYCNHIIRLVYLFAGITCCVCLAACDAGSSYSQTEKTTASDTPQRSIDVKYAIGFDLVYKQDHKLLHIIRHYKDSKDTLSYVLLHKGASVPAVYSTSPVIQIPIKEIVIMSSTHIALLDMLDAHEVIAGMADTQYVWNDKVRKRVQKGNIYEVGRGANINIEQLITMQPDVLMAVGFPELSYKTHAVIQNAGIPVLYNAEWQEKSVLGRAEWVKVMAALLDKESLAEQKFNQAVRAYDSLKNIAEKATSQPAVMCNIPKKGTWYVPGGNSYHTEIILDANGSYPYTNNEATGSVPISFEEIYQNGLKADVWIDAGLATSKRELLEKDERFSDFRPFQTNQVYNITKRWEPSKGNDYWERGMVYPHYILADLIKIFHPGLLPDYELTFYERIN